MKHTINHYNLHNLDAVDIRNKGYRLDAHIFGSDKNVSLNILTEYKYHNKFLDCVFIWFNIWFHSLICKSMSYSNIANIQRIFAF